MSCQVINDNVVSSCLTCRLTPVPTCYGTQWLANGGSCYYVSPTFGSDAKKTWFAARRFCRANGAELASIATDSANNFLMQIVSGDLCTVTQAPTPRLALPYLWSCLCKALVHKREASRCW